MEGVWCLFPSNDFETGREEQLGQVDVFAKHNLLADLKPTCLVLPGKALQQPKSVA